MTYPNHQPHIWTITHIFEQSPTNENSTTRWKWNNSMLMTESTAVRTIYTPCRGILLDPHDTRIIQLVPPAKVHTRGYSWQPFPTNPNRVDHASHAAVVLELLPEQTSTTYKPARSHRWCSGPQNHSCKGIRLALPLDQHVMSKVSAKANYPDDRP
jgi:hypothetical protein